jgi:UDP-N-acetylmuramoylalanine--D-glutamate ligase
MPRPGQAVAGFSLRREDADYALADLGGARWLVARGEPLLPLRDLRIAGLHNAANALAAVALADAVGIPRQACVTALTHFPGLPHRAQVVAEAAGVRWINDSKATNVGAALATLEGMAGPLILIAGGDGKGQDFAPLAAPLAGKVRLALLIGRDAEAVGAALEGACPVRHVATLEEAVAAAHAASVPGDTVILSPACASLDMFRDYAQRGEVFAAAAARVTA